MTINEWLLLTALAVFLALVLLPEPPETAVAPEQGPVWDQAYVDACHGREGSGAYMEALELGVCK